MKLTTARSLGRVALVMALLLSQFGLVLAQDAEASSSPAGLAMLVLFLGIAAMIGVLALRWSQTTQEDEESTA